MNCDDCPYYLKGPVLDACGLTGCEFSRITYTCDLVKEDGTINIAHPFFREADGK